MLRSFFSAFLVLMLLATAATAEETELVQLTCQWLTPTAHPLWESWMANASVDVSYTAATTNGNEKWSQSIYLGLEEDTGWGSIDVTGLPQSFLWGGGAVIELQEITGPQGQKVNIQSQPRSKFFRSEDGFEQDIPHLGLLSITPAN